VRLRQDQGLGPQVAEVKAQLVFTVGGIERRAGGVGRRRQCGDGHLGPVRKSDRNPIFMSHVGAGEGGSDPVQLRQELPIVEGWPPRSQQGGCQGRSPPQGCCKFRKLARWLHADRIGHLL
jgi:hypothetical protein